MKKILRGLLHKAIILLMDPVYLVKVGAAVTFLAFLLTIIVIATFVRPVEFRISADAAEGDSIILECVEKPSFGLSKSFDCREITSF